MHGRVKVRSSEEKAEAERKEKAAKVRVYRDLTSKIFTKREAGDKDQEALQLTSDVLLQNPDIATLWNYRRETLSSLLSSLPEEEGEKLRLQEKALTQQCLRINPKSYCVWLHRQWIMKHSPQPDWTSEISLCDFFLKYDERNFHCWDYRRFVTAKAAVPPSEEFIFTYDKIAANFSNYSAWHYRSKLLPLLHPSPPDQPGGVAENALLQEHELAQNAFFTDPSDQSAWFYHRWLLGKRDGPPNVACVLLLLRHLSLSGSPELFVSFTQPIKATEELKVIIGGSSSSTSSSSSSDWPQSQWRFPLSDDVIPSNNDGGFPVVVAFGEKREEVILRESDGSSDDGSGSETKYWIGGQGPVFGSVVTETKSSMLSAELDSCKELLTMEPKNKWCILTTLLLLQYLDWRGNSDEIITMFERLCEVDSYRRGYYQDMLSRFRIECSLRDLFQDGLSPTSPFSLSLSGKALHRLYHMEYLAHLRRLDISNNHLTSLTNIHYLVSLETLVADDNKLKVLPPEMKNMQLLEVVSLRNNFVSEVNQLQHIGTVVKVMKLQGNPLCSVANWRENLTKVHPSLVVELD